MHHRAQHQWLRTLSATAVVAAVAVACSETPPAPSSPGIVAANAPMSHHLGCNAGRRFTGGGRVDPSGVGKVTFGFNVNGEGICDENGGVKGQMQVVYHETQTLVHTLTMDHFSSFVDPVKGECGEFDGTARVKHVSVGGDWHEHHYFAEVCDKAEPGRGADRLTFTLDGERGLHENVMEEILTGGNIQAHKS